MFDRFYGLSGRPFQLTPDPHFYFQSTTHRKALSYLGYGLAQGEGFIVITGEVGAGKSTLVGHLMQTIDKSRLTAATIVTSQLDGNDMVHMAAESFGIASQGLDKTSTLKAIEGHLHNEARAGRRCLLIIDEAQNLSVDALEELRMLSNFQLGSTALLQIFLLGQPEFRDTLQQSAELEQLRQRVIATHHLDSMDADEVKPYIEHRMACVGWTGNPEVNEFAVDAVFNETQGVPRKINTLMSRVLLMGAMEQVNVIDAALVYAVIADLAGKPFDYEAPVQTERRVVDGFAPVVAVEETPMETLAVEEAAVEQLKAEVPDAVEMPAHASATVALASAQIDSELMARVQKLEAHMAETDLALRRTLNMLIDWMDKENADLSGLAYRSRAA